MKKTDFLKDYELTDGLGLGFITKTGQTDG